MAHAYFRQRALGATISLDNARGSECRMHFGQVNQEAVEANPAIFDADPFKGAQPTNNKGRKENHVKTQS